jgi:hypothetical protein
MTSAIEQITGDEYSVAYNPDTHTVGLSGTIRLQTSDDYAPLMALLQRAHDAAQGNKLKLDLRQLQFLNSSGISMISKFVIGARKQDQISLVVQGNQAIYWQQKSLGNLQKLWPKVVIDIS